MTSATPLFPRNSDKIEYTDIIHNGRLNQSLDVFDKKYDGDVRISTYSVSPKFLSKTFAHVRSLSIIVGISDKLYQANTAINLGYQATLGSILEGDSIDFFQDLSPYLQNRVVDKHISIHFAGSIPVHSKICLLSNKDGSETRVIIGSANFTDAALGDYRRQFETLRIDDNNSELYETYLNIYKKNVSYTQPFFDPTMLDNLQKNQKTSSKHPILAVGFADSKATISSEDLAHLKNPVLLKDPDVRKTIIQHHVLDYHERLHDKISSGDLPLEFPAHIQQELDEQKIALPQTQHVRERIDLVAQHGIKKPPKKQQGPIVINPKIAPFLVKMTPSAVPALVPISDPKAYSRLHLSRIDQVGLHPAPYLVQRIETDTPSVWSEKKDLAVIKNGLDQIDLIIDGYKNFLTDYSPNIGKKVFESILFAYTSPFLSILRARCRHQEDAQHIPLFMFMGGRACSGKSSLLRALGTLLQGNTGYAPFIDYSNIPGVNSSPRASQHTQNTKLVLRKTLAETNVFPLLVDELPAKFFGQDSSGCQEILMEISNATTFGRLAYPALIGTTNSANYSMDERLARRSYYIQMDLPFNTTNHLASEKHRLNVEKRLTTDLFQDFLYRFCLMIQQSDGELDQEQQADGYKKDFLRISRHIFKGYYKECGRDIPDFFSSDLLSDHQDNQRQRWKSLLDAGKSNPSLFKAEPTTNILNFYHHHLDPNAKNHSTKISYYADALPASIGSVSLNAHVSQLKAKELYAWLGISDPYQAVAEPSAEILSREKTPWFWRSWRKQ